MPDHGLAIYTCMICGKTISPQFWVCADCMAAHNLSDLTSEWPEWAKRLYADHTAERRQERDMLGYTVDAPDLYDYLCYGEDGGCGDGMDDDGEPLDDYFAAWEQLKEMGIDVDD